MRNIFRRRPNNFLKLLRDQATLTLKGMELLTDYMNDQDPAIARQITAAEKEADEVRRILIDELNRTFITPIDREDIFALSRAVDDVLDYAYSTVDEMEILQVHPTSYMHRIACLLRDAASEIHLAVQRLQDRPGAANEHAQRAKSLENRIEEVYREALADLFSGLKDIQLVAEMLKKREVYRHLSNAADRSDAAANVIIDIVLKTT